jgi:hypothetical protein
VSFRALVEHYQRVGPPDFLKTPEELRKANAARHRRESEAFIKAFAANQRKAEAYWAKVEAGTNPTPILDTVREMKKSQAVELAALRKSHAIDQHRSMVERHAAFGAKIDAAIKAKEITAIEAGTLEARWHHNGRALKQVGKRLGVLR